MRKIIINNIDNIRKCATEFITYIDDKTVFAFEGDMGAGKTTFIKAICEELGVKDVINSPTFSIINEYRNHISGESIYHFDLYRINKINEAQEIGIEDYLHSGSLCFIEWPEKIKNLLPENTLYISIKEKSDGSRTVSFT
jgi:tRNA threonylcarbamoyladenosine biosynthesis protein TsaE